MAITRKPVATDEPRRTGLKLRPSLNRELTALATLEDRQTSDLLNQAVAEFVERRRPGRGGRSSSRRDVLSA